MAYDKKIVNKARKLFDRGFTAPQIFDEMRGKIALRTIHRWVSEWKMESNPEREQTTNETQDILRESKELEEKSKPLDYMGQMNAVADAITALENKDSYIERIAATIVEINKTNTEFIDHLKVKFLDELAQPALNIRAITALSQAITRHTNIVIEMQALKIFNDSNAAFSKIKGMGYEVIDPDYSEEPNSKY